MKEYMNNKMFYEILEVEESEGKPHSSPFDFYMCSPNEFLGGETFFSLHFLPFPLYETITLGSSSYHVISWA
jgi:hypothetical protein